MKYCILYDGKICNDCGECNRCDLDPNKICDNCGKCIQEPDPNSEFRSINFVASDDEDGEPEYNEMSEEEKLRQAAFDAFLDEPLEIDSPEPLDIDPELLAIWEQKLAESFADKKETGETKSLRGVRNRRRRQIMPIRPRQ